MLSEIDKIANDGLIIPLLSGILGILTLIILNIVINHFKGHRNSNNKSSNIDFDLIKMQVETQKEVHELFIAGRERIKYDCEFKRIANDQTVILDRVTSNMARHTDELHEVRKDVTKIADKLL